MTNKKRFINAFRTTIKKYRNPIGERVFDSIYCSMCKVAKSINMPASFSCYGCESCPMCGRDGSMGCGEFRTYQAAENAVRLNGGSNVTKEMVTPRLTRAFNRRADALEKMIVIMEEWPNEWFTMSGWGNRKELPRGL